MCVCVCTYVLCAWMCACAVEDLFLLEEDELVECGVCQDERERLAILASDPRRAMWTTDRTVAWLDARCASFFWAAVVTSHRRGLFNPCWSSPIRFV